MAKKIVESAESENPFKIYIVIPAAPGMAGRLEQNTAFAQECIIHLTFESINRGGTSIGKYCEENGVENWSDFMYFASYRKTENVHGKPVQEIIYPHSKLMIVDDKHVIIGSSNINENFIGIYRLLV